MIKKIKQKIAAIILSAAAFAATISPVPVYAASAENLLAVAPTVDTSGGTLSLTITNVERLKDVYSETVEDENAKIATSSTSSEGGTAYYNEVAGSIGGGSFTTPKDGTQKLNAYSYLAYPGYNASGGVIESNGDDSDLAGLAVGTIGNSFNSLLEYIKKHSTDMFKNKGVKELADFFVKLSAGGTVTIDNDKNKTVTITYGVTEADLRENNTVVDSSIPGMDATCYAKIVITDPDAGSNETVILPYRIPKGYGKDQSNHSSWTERTSEDTEYTQIYISWQGLVRYASNAAAQGISAAEAQKSFDSSGDDNIDSLSSWAGTLVEKLLSSLGLYSAGELMTNSGTRGASYYLGVFPYSWQKGFNVVYWGAQVIAFFVLLYGILKLVIQRNMSLLGGNTKNAVDLRQGLLAYAETVVLMILFPVVFTSLLKLNNIIVSACASLSKGYSISSSGFFSQLLLGIAYAGILIKLNVEYLVRALSVGICYMISPISVSSIALDPGRKAHFNSQMKEMIANIFVQSFDAIVYVVIAVVASGTSRSLERLILLFAFIPLNKWFKDNIAGLRGQGSGGAAEEANRERSKFIAGTLGNIGIAGIRGAGVAAQMHMDNAAANTDEAKRNLDASIREAQDHARSGGTSTISSAESIKSTGADTKAEDPNMKIDANEQRQNDIRNIQQKQQEYEAALEKQKRANLIGGASQFGLGVLSLSGGLFAAGDGQNTSSWFDMATGANFAKSFQNMRGGVGAEAAEMEADRIGRTSQEAINSLNSRPLPTMPDSVQFSEIGANDGKGHMLKDSYRRIAGADNVVQNGRDYYAQWKAGENPTEEDTQRIQAIHKYMDERGMLHNYDAEKGEITALISSNDLQRNQEELHNIKNINDGNGVEVIYKQNNQTVRKNIPNEEYVDDSFDQDEWYRNNAPLPEDPNDLSQQNLPNRKPKSPNNKPEIKPKNTKGKPADDNKKM